MLSAVYGALIGLGLGVGSQTGLPLHSLSEPVDPRVIYGPDDRYDLYEVDDAGLRALARSSVSLFNRQKLIPNPETGQYDIVARSYGEEFKLCSNVRFFAQPAASYCSGVLIAPDLVLTAGHCVRNEQECAETYLVFDYAVRTRSHSHVPKSIPSKQVYSCLSIVARHEPPDEDLADEDLRDEDSPKDAARNRASGELRAEIDFALLRVSRPVLDRNPVPVSQETLSTGAIDSGDEVLKAGTPVFAIGHPSGLPQKISLNARVRGRARGEQANYFEANLDLEGGSSGSPVFHARSSRLLGIAVSGEIDFVEAVGHGCFLPKKCSDRACAGEDVLRISRVIPFFP